MKEHSKAKIEIFSLNAHSALLVNGLYVGDLSNVRLQAGKNGKPLVVAQITIEGTISDLQAKIEVN